MTKTWREALRHLLKGVFAGTLALLVAAVVAGCSGQAKTPASPADATPAPTEVSAPDADADADDAAIVVYEDAGYTSKDEVAAYIHEFGHLPPNFVSKTKARAAGWDASAGNLDDVLPGMSIGGSKFWDDDEQLPDAKGRSWTECDINYEGGYRGAERIVFSNDGLIFYTPDHYQTFEQLY